MAHHHDLGMGWCCDYRSWTCQLIIIFSQEATPRGPLPWPGIQISWSIPPTSDSETTLASFLSVLCIYDVQTIWNVRSQYKMRDTSMHWARVTRFNTSWLQDVPPSIFHLPSSQSVTELLQKSIGTTLGWKSMGTMLRWPHPLWNPRLEQWQVLRSRPYCPRGYAPIASVTLFDENKQMRTV